MKNDVMYQVVRVEQYLGTEPHYDIRFNCKCKWVAELLRDVLNMCERLFTNPNHVKVDYYVWENKR